MGFRVSGFLFLVFFGRSFGDLGFRALRVRGFGGVLVPYSLGLQGL